ncbi:MAG: hypothetical protein B7Z53_05955 [Rhodospirillales bacterium 12-71-4]|nr:MAG: hypothetical protein B7Z53_05955 [Rhodospirillales bacterium 12-71-4]
MLDPALRQARAELRAALGIAPDAPPAAVAAALRQAAPALRAGQAEAAAAALDPVAAGDGRRVLARLANLPPLPRAAFATGLALDELSRETRTDLE